MKDTEKNMFEAIKKLLLSEGKTEEEAVAIAEKRMGKISDFINNVSKSFFIMPLFNDDSIECLSCGRVVMCGPKCCSNPTYRSDEKRYEKYKAVKPTDVEGIFAVELHNRDYFVIEEKLSVYSNTMWPTKEQAIKDLEKEKTKL